MHGQYPNIKCTSIDLINILYIIYLGILYVYCTFFTLKVLRINFAIKS